METRQFPLRVVLTVATGRLLTKSSKQNDNGIGDLYEILNWMTSDNLFTHQLPRAGVECKPWLLRWFPELQRAIDELPLLDRLLEKETPSNACEAWLLEMKRHMREVYDVPKITADDHDVKDPLTELVDMRGGTDGIIPVIME